MDIDSSGSKGKNIPHIYLCVVTSERNSVNAVHCCAWIIRIWVPKKSRHSHVNNALITKLRFDGTALRGYYYQRQIGSRLI